MDLVDVHQKINRLQGVAQRLAWLCVCLVLSITCLSALIRLSQAPLSAPVSAPVSAQADCAPQLQCLKPSTAGEGAAAPSPAWLPAARLLHRVVASVALLVVLGLLMLCWALRSQLRAVGRAAEGAGLGLALGLLVLTLFLAVLGRWSAHSPHVGVLLGNLWGGFALLALSVRLALTLAALPVQRQPRVAAASLPRPWLWGALWLAWLGVGSGAFISVQTTGVAGWLPGLHWLGGALLGLFLLALAGRLYGVGGPGRCRVGASALLVCTLSLIWLGWGAQAPAPWVWSWLHNAAAALLLVLLYGFLGPLRKVREPL